MGRVVKRGQSHVRALKTGVTVGVLLALAILGAILATWAIYRARLDAAEARYWTVSGPPCLAVTRTAFAALPDPPQQSTVFQTVRFTRLSGAMSCSGAAAAHGSQGYAICQFNSPAVLAVKSKAVEAYFLAPGHTPATVTVDSRGVRCVLAGNYEGD